MVECCLALTAIRDPKKITQHYYWPGANVSGTMERLANLVACAVLRAVGRTPLCS